jgi:hypothetical protein
MSRRDFARIPNKIQQLILTSASSVQEKPGAYKEFIFSDTSLADVCRERVNKYERNRQRSESRLHLELSSPGTYEKSDIEAIRELQGGRCYFTGEPLSDSAKNWSLDHLRPVRSGGSFWPGNLALVLKSVNQEKHGRSKGAYWKFLASKHGAEWVEGRRKKCSKIDKERGKIHRRRRAEVAKRLSEIELELELCQQFGHFEVEFRLEGDAPYLCANAVAVCFPGGFLRRKKCFDDHTYFANIVQHILA